MSPYSAPLRTAVSLAAALWLLTGVAAAQTGTIQGTVTATGGGPVATMFVTILPVVGPPTLVQTNGAGFYSANALPAGAYFVLTRSSAGQINEIHSPPVNIQCVVACADDTARADGTAINVTDGGTSMVDFVLDPGGSISGTVTGSGTPLDGVFVILSSESGSRGDTTDVAGSFTFNGLPTGTYHLYTNDETGGWINEIHANLQCLGPCNAAFDAATAQPVAVTAPTPAAPVNFDLDPAGHITGTVTDDAVIPNPLPKLWMNLVTSAGELIQTVFTDVNGFYDHGGLPPGAYLVATRDTGTLINEVWDNQPCPLSCDSVNTLVATPIAVAAGATVSGRNFVLAEGGSISGTVTGQGSGGLDNANVIAVRTDGTLASIPTDATGAFTLKQMLPGTYRLYTQDGSGDWVDEIWDNIPCTVSCATLLADGAGAGIEVTAVPVTGKDFVLAPAGHITGTVIDAQTTTPLNLYVVGAFNADGIQVTMTATNASGVYTLGHLAPGSYYVATLTNTTHENGVWNNLLPPRCGFHCETDEISSQGALIIASAGATTPNINFTLPRLGSITGTVTMDAAGSPPLPGVNVLAYDAQGVLLGSVLTIADGTYSIGGLSAGTYKVLTAITAGVVHEVYDNVQCSPIGCNEIDLSNGTGIAVAGAEVANIHFALEPTGSITGIVTDAATTAPIEFAFVTLYLDRWGSSHCHGDRYLGCLHARGRAERDLLPSGERRRHRLCPRALRQRPVSRRLLRARDPRAGHAPRRCGAGVERPGQLRPVQGHPHHRHRHRQRRPVGPAIRVRDGA